MYPPPHHHRRFLCALLALLWLPTIAAQPNPSDENPPVAVATTIGDRNTDLAEPCARAPKATPSHRPYEVRTIQLEHAAAADVASLLTKASTPLHTDESVPGMSIVADKRTNTVIITASPFLLEQWAGAVTRLDVALPSDRDPTLCDTTRLELTAACIQGNHNRLVELDVTTLASKAATAESFLESLKEFGEVRTLATASAVVDLSKRSRVTRRTKAPYVRDRGTDNAGRMSTSVGYEDTSMLFDIQGSWSATRAGIGRHAADIELRFMADSDINVSPTVTSPMIHQVQLESRSEMTSGKPIILFASNTSGTADSANVIVCRLVLTQMHPD